MPRTNTYTHTHIQSRSETTCHRQISDKTRQDKGNAQRTCRTIKRAIKTTEHNKNYILFYFCVLWLSLSLSLSLSLECRCCWNNFKYIVKGARTSTGSQITPRYFRLSLDCVAERTSTWTRHGRRILWIMWPFLEYTHTHPLDFSPCWTLLAWPSGLHNDSLVCPVRRRSAITICGHLTVSNNYANVCHLLSLSLPLSGTIMCRI